MNFYEDVHFKIPNPFFGAISTEERIRKAKPMPSAKVSPPPYIRTDEEFFAFVERCPS